MNAILAAAVLSVMSSAVAQPKVVSYTIDAAVAAGIEAYHQGRSGFRSHLDRMSRGQAAAVADISDSMLFMTNTTDKPIDSTVVIYRFRLPGDPGAVWDDARQKPVPFFRQSFFVLAHSIRGPHFLPGETYAVYPGVGTVGPDRLDLTPNFIRRTREWLAQVVDVNISLDAVVFADGELAGPNTSGFDVRWNAERQAVGNIQREYLASTDHEAFVSGLLAARADPGVNIPDLMRHAGTWDAYMRRTVGNVLLGIPDSERPFVLEKIRNGFAQLRTKGKVK